MSRSHVSPLTQIGRDTSLNSGMYCDNHYVMCWAACKSLLAVRCDTPFWNMPLRGTGRLKRHYEARAHEALYLDRDKRVHLAPSFHRDAPAVVLHPRLGPARQQYRPTISPGTAQWTALKLKAPRSGAIIGTLKLLLGECDGYLLGQLGKKRSRGLELSNLGPFPVDNVEKPPAGAWGGAWTAIEVAFAQADPALSCALVINAAGAPHGGLGLVVSWGKGAVNVDLAQEFFTEFKAGVQALLSSADGKWGVVSG
ncbi:hypothetical protein C8Q78DRAFT_1074834 [Trametes maxima]|nr:hypothetical protein C8Q78DRAFT_1074834 [Trametes maxima]